MSRRTTPLLRAALSALHYSGAGQLAAPFTGGAGVIFMLHHVSPAARKDFEPNRILKITPDFLDTAIRTVLEAGFEPIALDDVQGRLATPTDRPFACFTFDDGYRDNRDHALPVFRRHSVPFTIYVPTDYADGAGDLWWLVLEEAIARLAKTEVTIAGRAYVFDTATDDSKTRAFHQIYWALRRIGEAEARAIVAALAIEAGFDTSEHCRNLVMSWDELRDIARDPLVTIGAHTKRHFALAKLDEASAHSEITESVARVEREIGRPCRHFSYPYGEETSAGAREFQIARELGLATAVTTRKGLLHAPHASSLTALPRLSLNGDFQDARYLKVLLSGVPFALRDAVRRTLARAA